MKITEKDEIRHKNWYKNYLIENSYDIPQNIADEIFKECIDKIRNDNDPEIDDYYLYSWLMMKSETEIELKKIKEDLYDILKKHVE